MGREMASQRLSLKGKCVTIAEQAKCCNQLHGAAATK